MAAARVWAGSQCFQVWFFAAARAISELLHPEADSSEWLFPREKATGHNRGNGRLALKPIQNNRSLSLQSPIIFLRIFLDLRPGRA
jgi:hypothetical protein